MAIFDGEGQATEVSLSDESLMELANAEERQETESGAPAAEDTIEEQEAEKGETPEEDPGQEQKAEESSPAPQGITEKKEEPQQNAELARLQKQYNDLRAWTTRVAQENSLLKKAQADHAALAQKQVEQPKEPKDFLKDLVNGGEDGLKRLIEKEATKLVQPILTERQEAGRRQRFSAAFSEIEKEWSQLSANENRQAMIKEMVDIAEREGNIEAWRDKPDFYMFRACRSLWGMPKVADPAAIEAARKAEREAVIREYEEKQKKAGLTVQTAANKAERAEKLSPEEQIAADIMKVGSGGLFK